MVMVKGIAMGLTGKVVGVTCGHVDMWTCGQSGQSGSDVLAIVVIVIAVTVITNGNGGGNDDDDDDDDDYDDDDDADADDEGVDVKGQHRTILHSYTCNIPASVRMSANIAHVVPLLSSAAPSTPQPALLFLLLPLHY
jgi:hypothetical protein